MSELIPTGVTFGTGRKSINNAFSAETSFNVLSASTIISGSTNLYDIFATSGGSGSGELNIVRVDSYAVGYTATLDDAGKTFVNAGSTKFVYLTFGLSSPFDLAFFKGAIILSGSPGVNIIDPSGNTTSTFNLDSSIPYALHRDPKVGFDFRLVEIVKGTSSTGSTDSPYVFDGSDSINTVSGSNVSSGGYSTVLGGKNNQSSGIYSITAGLTSSATTGGAVSIGIRNLASGDWSQAFGYENISSGVYSTTFGDGNTASDRGSIATGVNTESTGLRSFSMGQNTRAWGGLCVAIGNGTTALTSSDFSQGQFTLARGGASHAEGNSTIAEGVYSHAEGSNSIASGQTSHAEGSFTQANGLQSHAEGNSSRANGVDSHAEGTSTLAQGNTSHAEGQGTSGTGIWTHAEGLNTLAQGNGSHAQGQLTQAIGNLSHAEGSGSISLGGTSHAEGVNTTASGQVSHAEGRETWAIGAQSHSEGEDTIAFGENSHAQGQLTSASGTSSHAGGFNSQVGLNGTYAFIHSTSSYVNANSSAILGGSFHQLDSTAAGSVILGGTNITATTSNTVYTPSLKVSRDFSLGSLNSAISSNVNDWSATIGNSSIRLNASVGGLQIGGMQGGVESKVLYITNVGSNSVTFVNEAVTSSAENRMILGNAASNITILQDQIITFQYDDVSQRWRHVSTSA